MTTTAPSETSRRGGRAEAAHGGAATGSPVKATPPTKTRRRPAIIAAGVALVIVGGLGAVWYASSVGDTVAVLVTKGDIARGQTIESSDLTTLEIGGGQSTAAVTAKNADQVIGEVAKVDLPAGSLVTTDNVGVALEVADDESIVGVALTAAQMPSYPLTAGDAVRIVDTPIAQGDPPSSTPQSYEATVFTTRFDEATSQWIVDLVVPKSRAADIAARAATGRIALVLDGNR